MNIKSILVTGGAGYVGAVLVPKLLKKGYKVRVLDWYMFGRQYFNQVVNKKNLKEIKGDIRDKKLLAKELKGIEAVIHLACISNDVSFDANPAFGREVNFEATKDIYKIAKTSGVKRFIFASSSSVYGIKDEKEVTERLPLEPMTDYAKYKALSEEFLLENINKDMISLIVRPAAICGYSPRLRLDLSVNTLTIQALVNKKITVFGGQQKRSQIHIQDMTDFYVKSLEYPESKINGKIYNITSGNYRIIEIARLIEKVLRDKDLKVIIEPQIDNRSYHICGKKVAKELGFKPKLTVEDAVRSIKSAYINNLIPNALTDPHYYNIKMLKLSKLL